MLVMSHAALAQTGRRDLYLETFVNDAATGLVAHFVERRDGRLATAPKELRDIGLLPQAAAIAADGLVDLDRLDGVTYRLDAPAQAIHFTASESSRVPRVFDAQKARLRDVGEERAPVAKSANGAVLNYLLFGATESGNANVFGFGDRQSALSAALDGRLFGELGVLSQSGIVQTASDSNYRSVRLDTTWSYADPRSLMNYRSGDLISGGLTWTRPIRLGGVQAQRSFSLRPDLVTMPLPAFTGSAAVPSTVDVYFNNVKTYSQKVPPGPFEINNLPVLAGGGIQSVVIRDSLGRQTVTSQPIYASPKLLRAGLYDYSVESGFRRYSYGVQSNDYDPDPVASATLRGGITDNLTLETHVEGGASLINGGAGVAFPFTGIGVGSLSLAGSSNKGATGLQAAAGVEFNFNPLRVFARAQQTFRQYADLASLPSASSADYGVSAASLLPPKQLYQTGVTIPFKFDPSSLTLSLSRLKTWDDQPHDILGASYSRTMSKNTTLFVNGFADLHDRGNFGVFAGLTISLDDGISATASVSQSGHALTGGVDINKSLSAEPDSYGWSLHDHEGAVADRAAGASYRTPFARLAAGVQQVGDSSRVTGEMEGAVATVNGGVFFANRIDDAFAVVDAGAPGVNVFYENRPAGHTGQNGQALIPTLRAYEPNQIAIDPDNLPVNAVVQRTKETVVPPARGAVIVDFGVATDRTPLRAVLHDARGALIPAGTRGTIEETGETFVVGYDGEIYLENAKAGETLRIERGSGDCRVAVSAIDRDNPVQSEALACR